MIKSIDDEVTHRIPISVNPIVMMADPSSHPLVMPPKRPAAAKMLTEEYNSTSAFLKYVALCKRCNIICSLFKLLSLRI
jgi:hypothetical protein